MKGKLILCLLLGVILVTTISASDINNIGTFKRTDSIDLVQYCDTCTYVNISSILLPNGTLINLNEVMTKSNYDYNYAYEIDDIGLYSYTVCGDKDGSLKCETLNFEVTEFGDKVNTSQGLVLIAEGLLIALFFGMGRVFEKKKWKLKIGFDVIALLMAVVLTNSIRIVAAQSSNLTAMGESMFIGTIVIFLFMIAYMLIMFTIEVVQYFKKKERNKWEMDNNAY